MKVLFSNSYFYNFDQKQSLFKKPYPPIATIIAANSLRNNGYEVSLHDTSLSNSPLQIIQTIAEFKPDVLVIYEDGFNYLTKMCLSKMRNAAFDLVKIGKDYNCKVIVSSSDSTDNYSDYLTQGADFVLIGEGDKTLIELISNLDTKKEIGHVNGIAYSDKFGKIIKTLNRDVLSDIDSIGYGWDLIDIPKYKSIWEKYHGYFSLNISTTRGCPFKCNWCAKPIYGNRYNVRSVINVVNEIEFLVNKFNVKHFWMCDDIFGLKQNWVQEFRDEVLTRQLKFKFKIQSRADLLMIEDSIDALVASGLDEVWIGAESGSQKILDSMEKGTTIEQINLSTKLLKLKKVKVCYFIQFGYLGETMIEINETINMILKNMPHQIGISVSYPLPGTKFYQIVKDQMNEKTNWNDSNDLTMMYEGSFNTNFYVQLYKYVHSIYRYKYGIQSLKLFYRNISIENLKYVLSGFYFLPKSIYEKYKLNRLI